MDLLCFSFHRSLCSAMPLSIYFAEVYLNCHGAKQSFDLMTPTAAAVLALTRLITPRIHRTKLYEIVTSMMDDWTTQQDKRVRWLMKKYASMSTRITVLTFILVSITVGTYVSTAMSMIRVRADNNISISQKKSVQYCVFRSPSSHQAFVIIQAVQMFITGISTFGTTSFFFGLAMHLCSQFDALGIKLSDSRVDKTHYVIANVVQRHCHLIHLADCIEESFNKNILIYLFITVILMCTNGFMLIVSLQLGNLFMIIHDTSVLLLMMIQLSFYTFAGDCLEMRSAALSYATYDCDWYELPASKAKDFQIILMRASISHQLTAGKFIIMNMMTFKDILKSTASYLSVLRIMLDE